MQRFSFSFRAMACENEVALFAPSEDVARRAADAAIDEVRRIEQKYSRYRDDSVVSAINNAPFEGSERAWTPVDQETAQLLEFADSCYLQSGGLFDPTSGVLRRVWNFQSNVPPTSAAISQVLHLVGWQYVERRADAVRLTRPTMELDFGGFGKEYAADRAAAVLLSHGIAHGFVNLGGDVVVTGPQSGGQPWSLGIRHPRREGEVVETVAITSGAVATSGDYERYIEVDGRRYSHILDPRNGQPVLGLQSVTVFASSCLIAGAVTTIAMLKGNDAGLLWLAGVLRETSLPVIRGKIRGLVVDAGGVVHRY
jgi:thiamine biosynthesis lipoprotein